MLEITLSGYDIHIAIGEYINKHLPIVKKQIQSYIKGIDEKVVKIKLKEAINSIDKFCKIDGRSKVVKDSVVIQTMRYMELLKELKKSANKNKKTL